MALVAALGLSACGTTQKAGLAPPQDSQTAVKDRTVATHFRDRGIEIHYTMTGKLEKIYVWGVAPAWRGEDQARLLAELDAKNKLVKFLFGEQSDSSLRAKIIGRSLDRARDNTLNRFDSNTSSDADFSFDSAAVEADLVREPEIGQSSDDNTSRRLAETIDKTLVTQVQTLTTSGRLTGVIKVDDGRSKDGKFYFAKYEWSERLQGVSETIRNRMK